MVNKPKQKGTAAETRVVNYLLAAGLDAVRVVLHGTDDQGDIHIISSDRSTRVCLEVKGGKQTAKVARKQREDWLAETINEGIHADMDAYLVIAKHGSSVCDYHVWSCNGHNFWYFDEFIRRPIIQLLRRVEL
jgi:Holliday junction resolvase-like predicted endonuclease